MQSINIVWFKRDLRLHDHPPLQAAIAAGLPTLLLYCYEPSWMAAPDSDVRHWRFVRQSIDDMKQELARNGLPFCDLVGEFKGVLEALRTQVRIHTIFSHEETGNALTYARDKAVAAFCREHSIAWQEFPTHGVQRCLYHRKDWEARFVQRMSEPVLPVNWSAFQPFHLPDELLAPFRQIPLHPDILRDEKLMQPGGQRAARAYLDSFLEKRRKQYYKHISKPEAARYSCSRISPYLTWGNLSVRQVYQAAQRAMEQNGDRYNLGQFVSRLFWQSHFIQKFETECRMEFENLNRGFDNIRTEVNATWVQAWAEGRTGFPLVDACMRCVVATGYLNFRMRAMLVSFLTHHLWQPWQAGVHHLARQFLDYEPGIHYSQFQMQSGVMGVNTIRIYNPVKQGLEHDPEGVFIRKWVPELAHLPTPFVHEPWKMTAMEAAFYQFYPGETYPSPIVDIEKTHREARDRLWAQRSDPKVLAENQRILRVHTKRKKAEESSIMGDPATQRRLQQDRRDEIIGIPDAEFTPD